METVADILRLKGAEVLAVTPDTTALEAARRMNERGAGSVLVLEEGGLVGIFTERDVMRRVVAAQRDPATPPVREVMTCELRTCDPKADVEDCARTMSEARVRHLPVTAGARLLGVVTSGDLLAYRLSDQASTIRQLHEFIYDGR